MYIHISCTVRTSRIVAVKKGNVFEPMLRCCITVLMYLAGDTSFAPTSHGDVRSSALDGEEKLKSAAGTAISDVRRQLDFYREERFAEPGLFADSERRTIVKSLFINSKSPSDSTAQHRHLQHALGYLRLAHVL